MKQEINTHGRLITKQVKYSEGSGEIVIARLPAGARAKVNVTVDEVFTTASNKVNVGFSADTTKFINQFSILSVAGKNSDVMLEMTDGKREIVAKIDSTDTAGAYTVNVEFWLPTTQEVSY